ncbi:MAG: ribonuclease P protein component [Cyanobacteria bacterium SZAS TMP-1]|nr:ribonuclease P protein component [Cyanobacteria bacterium SZAS TMP-1]
MLAASERLRKTSVFQRAYAAKNSVNSGCVTLYVLLKRSKGRPDYQAGSSHKQISPATDEDQKGQAPAAQGGNWPSKSFPLVGFSISKKVLKSACKRNRAKRRIREAYRGIRKAADPQLVAQIRMERFYSLVFVINPSVLNLKFEDVTAAVRDSLIKASKKFSHKS